MIYPYFIVSSNKSTNINSLNHLKFIGWPYIHTYILHTHYYYINKPLTIGGIFSSPVVSTRSYMFLVSQAHSHSVLTDTPRSTITECSQASSEILLPYLYLQRNTLFIQLFPFFISQKENMLVWEEK